MHAAKSAEEEISCGIDRGEYIVSFYGDCEKCRRRIYMKVCNSRAISLHFTTFAMEVFLEEMEMRRKKRAKWLCIFFWVSMGSDKWFCLVFWCFLKEKMKVIIIIDKSLIIITDQHDQRGKMWKKCWARFCWSILRRKCAFQVELQYVSTFWGVTHNPLLSYRGRKESARWNMFQHRLINITGKFIYQV